MSQNPFQYGQSAQNPQPPLYQPQGYGTQYASQQPSFPAQAESGGLIPGLGLSLGLTGQASQSQAWLDLMRGLSTAQGQPFQLPVGFGAAAATAIDNNHGLEASVAVAKATDDTEEGELSDPNFDDLYESDDPADEPPKPVATRALPANNNNPLGGGALSGGSNALGGGSSSAISSSTFAGIGGNALSGARNAQPAPTWDMGALNILSPLEMLAAMQQQQQQQQPLQYPTPQQLLQLQSYVQPQQPQPQSNNSSAPSKPFSPILSQIPSQPAQMAAAAQERKIKKATRKKAKKMQKQLAAEAKAATKATANQLRLQRQKAAASNSFALAEARRNAQAAILNLLPLQVTIQNFVEEGIDEKVVRRFFSQLGINPDDPSSNKVLVPPPMSKAQQPDAPPPPPASLPKKPVPTVKPAVKPVVVMDKSGEERKDRIARLLAAKAAKGVPVLSLESGSVAPSITSPDTAKAPENTDQKQSAPKSDESRPAPASAPASTTRHSPAPPPPPTPKPINKSDLLQQKLEALKKKREAGKAFSALDISTSSNQVATPMTAPFDVSMQQAQSEAIGRNMRSASTGGTVSSPHVPQISALNTIPGLSTSSSTSSRKRPVAADFVADSPSTPAKRPAYPRDEKLIIDVSEESDDDVEMGLGTPADDPRRLVKDSSRSTSSALANPQLAKMNKQIEDMKRRIAEVEARKKSKQVSASASVAASNRSSKSPSIQSPSIQLPTDEDVAMSGASQIPLRHAHTATGDSNDGLFSPPLPRVPIKEDTPEDRRSRPTSESLPVVEASLVQKRSRLEQLRLEIARLQGEVDEDTKEQERLQAVDKEGVNQPPVSELDAVATSMVDSGDVSAAQQSIEATGRPESVSEAVAKVEQPQLEDLEAQPANVVAEAMADAVDAMEARSSPASAPQPEEKEEEDDDPSDSDSDSDAMNVESPSYAPDAGNGDSGTTSGNSDDTNENGGNDAASKNNGDATTIGGSDAAQAPPEPRLSFRPYESALRHFRSFRYHPEYKQQVAGGLKSLTYSHKIDANRALCQQELLDGTCANRSECLYQHFDTIKIPDDQIMLQLSNDYTPFDNKQQVRYINGLRELLSALRAKEQRDFGAITQAIIDYRTKFRGKGLRILPLRDGDGK